MNDRSFNDSNVSLKIVKTEIKPTGESVQIVRPLVNTTKSSDQIIDELVNRFDYKTNDVQASGEELDAVQQAFGSNLAEELIKTYDGSNLVSDSQQDLIGEKYLAEQIKIIQEQQRTTSILDKWSHLLYEGEKDYKTASSAGGDEANVDMTTIGDETMAMSSAEPAQSVYLTSNNMNINESTASQYSFLIQPNETQLQQTTLASATENMVSQFQLSQSGNLIHSNSQHSHHSQHSNRSNQPQSQEQKTSLLNESSNVYIEVNKPQSRSQSQSQSRLEPRTMSDLRKLQQAAQQEKLQTEFRSSETRIRTDARGGAGQSCSNTNRNNGGTSYDCNSGQQSTSYLPQFSSSNINSITIDAYNSPQFKAMLEQLTKPINIPPEHVNYPPEWPSQDKINLLAEPIYIPAPQPIVIPAPNIINLTNESSYSRSNLPDATLKPTVNYYPTIASDQGLIKNYGIRQLNLDASLARTGSNLTIPRY